MNSAIFGLFGAMAVGFLTIVGTAVYALSRAEQYDNFGDHDTGHERYSQTER